MALPDAMEDADVVEGSAPDSDDADTPVATMSATARSANVSRRRAVISSARTDGLAAGARGSEADKKSAREDDEL